MHYPCTWLPADEEDDGDAPASDGDVGKVGGLRWVDRRWRENTKKPQQIFEESSEKFEEMLMEDGRMRSIATMESFGSRVFGSRKDGTGEKLMETADFSITGDVRMRKDPILHSFQGCSEVGFGSGALKRRCQWEVVTLRLRRILDGDDKSKAALNDLKARWEKKFGRFAANKLVTAPIPSRKPTRCGERGDGSFSAGKCLKKTRRYLLLYLRRDSSSVSGDRDGDGSEWANGRKILTMVLRPSHRRTERTLEQAALKWTASLDDVAPCVDDVALCVDEVEADVAYEVNADVTNDVTARAYVTDARAD
ncbi:UNVERIFIED_CONTAM: hypothetical protein Sindi_2876800, partial [Sesamum indicum]